jgi:hypothetical protein
MIPAVQDPQGDRTNKKQGERPLSLLFCFSIFPGVMQDFAILRVLFCGESLFLCKHESCAKLKKEK